jgi:hypothetical protein
VVSHRKREMNLSSVLLFAEELGSGGVVDGDYNGIVLDEHRDDAFRYSKY